MTQATSITTEYQITVSSPVWQRVEQIAGEFNLSVSELLEQIGEGQLKVVAVPRNSDKLSDRDIANAFIWLAAQTEWNNRLVGRSKQAFFLTYQLNLAPSSFCCS
jgi:hypothetical protein